jgi:hypothetical protein
MRFLIVALTLTVLLGGCSRLDVLTEETLLEARGLWRSTAPGFYRLTVEMSGERIETGIFEVLVRDGEVVSLKRNGQVVLPDRSQDYSIEGLFRLLEMELALAQEPSSLGAAPGYSAHLLVRFDEETGRLDTYRRTVSNP